MSKEINYICDSCLAKVNNVDDSVWLEIGSKDGGSFQARRMNGSRTIYNMHDLHFCCGPCLLDYFYVKV